MPVSILVRVLIGAVSAVAAVCAVAGVITRTDIIDKIKENIKKHKYKTKNSKKANTNQQEEDEDIFGAMIREVTKNKKTVKADILNRNHEVVATEIFEGTDVSNDIYEGAVIIIRG